MSVEQRQDYLRCVLRREDVLVWQENSERFVCGQQKEEWRVHRCSAQLHYWAWWRSRFPRYALFWRFLQNGRLGPATLHTGDSRARVHYKKYGSLSKETWKEDLKRGFSECWRVLQDYGVLIFKRNEAEKKLAEILPLFTATPLFGHTTGSRSQTKWLCFMKIPPFLQWTKKNDQNTLPNSERDPGKGGQRIAPSRSNISGKLLLREVKIVGKNILDTDVNLAIEE